MNANELYELKEDRSIVVILLSDKATNKYGNVLRWVRLENGNTVSIWQDELNEKFEKCSN